MSDNASVQLVQIITLLQELKGELHETRKDIRWLKKKAGFGQIPPRKRAIITLPESYEFGDPSITLSADDWERVKGGETLRISGNGLNPCEGVSYCDYWEFGGGGVGGTVKLQLGLDDDDNEPETEYEGELFAEFVEEIDEPRKKRR